MNSFGTCWGSLIELLGLIGGVIGAIVSLEISDKSLNVSFGFKTDGILLVEEIF